MSGRRTMGGSAGGGKGGRGGGITYQRNEPSFLRKLKEQVGYKEAVPDVTSKHSTGAEDDVDPDVERPDELPTVVVLRKGDLTAEEAQLEETKNKQIEDESGPTDGRIIFKKPSKRTAEPSCEVENPAVASKKEKRKEKKPAKHLLSFGDEEDDC